jgi:hypothetical protein
VATRKSRSNHTARITSTRAFLHSQGSKQTPESDPQRLALPADGRARKRIGGVLPKLGEATAFLETP